MKILLINNYYYNRGGDCTYLFSLKNLLEDKGHQVIVFSMHHPQNFSTDSSKYFVSYINYPDELKNMRVSAVFDVLSRTIYSLEAKTKLDQLIEEERPDIAHLQNIHHHLTPSIFYPLKRNHIPIVWTLHDFTLICPNTSFLDHSRICEKCKKWNYFWPPITKCKKNSFSASTMAAIETALQRIMQVNELVDVFIAPSNFMKSKLIEYGFDEKNILQLNNFTNIKTVKEIKRGGNYFLYAGRIAQEKGIKTLIDAALKADGHSLKIVGEGPLMNEMVSYVRSRNGTGIEFLGHRNHEEVIDLLMNCRFLVLPSECYENYPYSIIEAFACGKPVIATRIGGIPELVKNWDTGLLFEPGDSGNLNLKINFLLNHPEKTEEMGERAKRFVERELSAERHYKILMNTYECLTNKVNKEQGDVISGMGAG
jgi:glycosyltransferase involved in cell wall biosynthesis